jgi:RHS repeat-associated protein
LNVPTKILSTLFVLIAICCSAICSAQIPSETDTTSTPVPYAGHDYIQGMSETVNPANGSLSIRIGVPLPPSRGLTLPFGFAYDSNGAYYLNTCLHCYNFDWWTTTAMLSQGGWSYTVPMLSVSNDTFTVQTLSPSGVPGTFVCYGRDNFVFQDASGSRRNLGLAYYNQNSNCQNNNLGGIAATFTNVEYGSLQATTTSTWTGDNSGNLGATNAVTVVDGDGTAYAFAAKGAPPTLPPGERGCPACAPLTYPPSAVADRNGNTESISYTGTGWDNNPGLTYTDSAGRTALSVPTFGAATDNITVAGLANPYHVNWSAVQGNFTISMTPQESQTCTGPGTQPSISAVSSIELPNGQEYTFQYDPGYGLVNKITYPSGGYVRYVWGLNPQSEYGVWQTTVPNGSATSCAYIYDSPAILFRFVSFDGVNEVLQQQFSYSTTWGTGSNGFAANDWITKITTVYTTDLTRGTQYKTVYNYSPAWADIQPSANGGLPAEVPVEGSVLSYDTTGNLLQTVTKTWLNERAMKSQVTQFANGDTAETDKTYYPASNFYPNPGTGWAVSATTEMLTEQKDYNGTSASGTLMRDTQISSYDTGFSQHIVDKPTFAAVISPPQPNGIVYAQRTYSYDGNGNLLSRSDAVGTAPTLTTSHTYDSYGNIITTTDPALNTTSYSYTNNFAANCSTTAAPSIYLTKITYPATPHAPNPDTETFQYNCPTGELARSTDENNNSTSYVYESLFNRLHQITYPQTATWGTELISYTDTPGEVSIETQRFDGSSAKWSDEVDQFDGLFHQISKSALNAQNTWNRTDTCLDGDARTLKSIYPYQAASGTSAETCSNPGDSFVYDAFGRVEKQTHSDGTFVSTTYTGRATDVKDEGNGIRSTERINQVDALGRLASVCEVTSSAQNGVSPAPCALDYGGTGFLTSYTYDPLGNLKQVTQGPEIRTFNYDMVSRLTSSTNPETGTIAYKYDTDSSCTSAPSYAGELISKTDNRGMRTCMQYDARHHVVAKTYPNDSTPPVTYGYNQASAYGHTLTNTFGRLSSESTGGANPTGSVFSYDVMGHVIDNSQCTPLNCATNSPYPITYTYAVPGMISATDGNSNTLNYGYNSVSQLSSVTSSSGVYPSTLLSNIVYNAFDTPTTSSIGLVPLTDTREYDVRGRVRSISVDNPNATQSTTTINVSGTEQSTGGPTSSTGSVVIQGAEQSGTFCNDAGLECHLKYDNGTVTVTVNGANYNASYGQGSTPSTIATSLAEVLNSSGVVTATSSAGTVTVTSVAKGTSADYSLSASSTSSYSGYPEYFGSFNPVPSGSSLTGGGFCSGTCDAGTLTVTLNGTAVTAHYGGTDNANSVAASLMTALNTSSPDVSAQLTTSGTGVILTSMPSGTYADFSFVAATASTAGFSSPSFALSPTSGAMAQGTGTEVYAAGVSYAPNGDVANSNDSVNGSWLYTYDDFNRLLTGVSDTGEGCSETYDRYGNRLTQAPYQGSCFTGNFNSTNGNPYQAGGLVYDGAGNVTNDGTYLYTYDSEERVSTISTTNNAPIATYIYDAEGRRVRKIASSNSEDDIYDLSGHVVSAFSTTATTWLRGEVFAGGAHLATWSGATYFAHADWLGTERIRSTVGGVVDPGSQWTSLPFGEGSATANPSPLHFTGKVRDQESGNDYFGARYYGSSTGRFLSPDPITVTSARQSDPQQLNLYSYVRNNPLTLTDPSGLIIDTDDLNDKDKALWAKVANLANKQDANGNYVNPALHSAYSALDNDSRTFKIEDDKSLGNSVAGQFEITKFNGPNDFSEAKVELNFGIIKSMSSSTQGDYDPSFQKYAGLFGKNGFVLRLAETFGHEGSHGVFAQNDPAQGVNIQRLINDAHGAVNGARQPIPPDVLQKVTNMNKALEPTERFAQQQEKTINKELQQKQ